MGSATIPDSFSFNIDSSTSAMNALHNFGAGPVPADAFVELEITLTTAAPITGANLRLTGLPSLSTPNPGEPRDTLSLPIDLQSSGDATLATGLELWLEGYNCAVNPRLQFHGDLSAPESTFTAHPAVGSFNDSMLSPNEHYDDPLKELRRTFAEAAMQDSDANIVRTGFLDIGFAPNPDFRGFPRDIPQFNAQTGATGRGAAEGSTNWSFGSASGASKWHGNGTVAVAGGVFGNHYGFAGSGGQMMQPMLYLMGGIQFAFEAASLIERAVADGADLINISAGFPCRILSVIGPIGICSVDDRAALIAQINLLVAAANGLICGVAPIIEAFIPIPGFGAFTCGLSTTAKATLLSTFFESLFASSALGNPRQPMERGIRAATNAGVPIVVSAGNRYNFSSTLGELGPSSMRTTQAPMTGRSSQPSSRRSSPSVPSSPRPLTPMSSSRSFGRSLGPHQPTLARPTSQLGCLQHHPAIRSHRLHQQRHQLLRTLRHGRRLPNDGRQSLAATLPRHRRPALNPRLAPHRTPDFQRHRPRIPPLRSGIRPRQPRHRRAGPTGPCMACPRSRTRQCRSPRP